MRLLRITQRSAKREHLERLANTIQLAYQKHPESVLKEARSRYPSNTRFIVLPMDLRGMNLGTPPQDILQQHKQLAELAQKKEYQDIVIPFIHIDPRSLQCGGPDPIAFIKEFHRRGFRGIKLYPPLGYAPRCESVLPIYEYANKHGLPVMVHCSFGGVRARGLKDEEILNIMAPHQYRAILTRFPNMKLCLAHFGGNKAWDAYLKDPWPMEPKQIKPDRSLFKKLGNRIKNLRCVCEGKNELEFDLEMSLKNDDNLSNDNIEQMNWLSQILTMIRSNAYPNLYTDISYTIFRFHELVSILKVFLVDEAVRTHTLFGSDYYMSDMAGFSERELSIRLRAELGEDYFWQIAETNPAVFLGEKTGSSPNGG
ncbi:MAG: amidohydrolase family protein [Chloroflexota bacterium]